MTSDSRDPKQRILEAAVDLFAQKGFAATGVRIREQPWRKAGIVV